MISGPFWSNVADLAPQLVGVGPTLAEVGPLNDVPWSGQRCLPISPRSGRCSSVIPPCPPMCLVSPPSRSAVVVLRRLVLLFSFWSSLFHRSSSFSSLYSSACRGVRFRSAHVGERSPPPSPSRHRQERLHCETRLASFEARRARLIQSPKRRSCLGDSFGMSVIEAEVLASPNLELILEDLGGSL